MNYNLDCASHQNNAPNGGDKKAIRTALDRLPRGLPPKRLERLG